MPTSKSSSQKTVAIMWFRRDLRVSDNRALHEALKSADEVVPVFVLDDKLRNASGNPRLAFLYGCLEALDKRLDGHLAVRSGPPEKTIPALVEEVGASAVFCTGESEPYGRDRDEKVHAALQKLELELTHVDSPYVVEPGFITKDDGTPFKVYTPYWNQWRSHEVGKPLQTPRSPSYKKIKSDGIPAVPSVPADLPDPGELAAQRRLDRFVDQAVNGYDENRNLPGVAGTSRMSPYLKFGCIHPRQIMAKIGAGAGADAYRREICFRDFYADTLFHNPDSLEVSMNEQMRSFEQDTGKQADERFAAWSKGLTGIPIVDAGMRQLQAEAWIHNRVRMIVASFLIKDLHVDWQRGADWFMEYLVDGDPASNSQGWQWVAGTGRDPSPYFRIFNPVTQGQKFDKAGEYLRRFVPELEDVPDKYVHTPWENPDGLPDGYPAPIVDHKDERAESLRRYDKVRGK